METSKGKKKAFALEQIAPYYKDPSLCGVDASNNCCYLTEDGKMCVAGKNLASPSLFRNEKAITSILREYGQIVFKPESKDILTDSQWRSLQGIHDAIAKLKTSDVKHYIDLLGLFTLEELQEYVKP